MAKARYRLTRMARQDLAAIGRYTERRWGPAQRQAYLAQLDAKMDLLVDHPQMGVTREDVGRGYRCLREGRHLIFYRAAADRVEIVRILHQRMDVRRYLGGLQ